MMCILMLWNLKKWRSTGLECSLFHISVEYFISLPQDQMKLQFQNTKAHYKFFFTKKNETSIGKNIIIQALKKKFFSLKYFQY